MSYFEELIKPQQESLSIAESANAEEEDVAVRAVIKLTRKQIYDEVWSVAVSGMASKYGIPYSFLLKQIKNANIPIPPSGHWTKLKFNKETTVTPLQGNPDEEVVLYADNVTRSGSDTVQVAEQKSPEELAVSEQNNETSETVPLTEEASLISQGEPETETGRSGQENNRYRREILYNEVWRLPIDEVAKKYAISKTAIGKICMALNIPVPSPSYWVKIRAGKNAAIIPLPKRRAGMNSVRDERVYTKATENQLMHLSQEDRTVVMAVASQLVVPEEHEKMDPKVAACYKKATAEEAKGILSSVAKESVPRVVKILDALAKAAIPLGFEIDDQLRFSIGKDTVILHFSEATKEVPHQLTQQEKMALLEYEDAKRHHHWAREPQIRKHDYIYKGTLSLSINNKRKLRDSKSGRLEDRLDEILIALFYCVHEERLAREEREEKERKREEEKRRQEEIRERYNEEVAKTNALVNQANDFEIAEKIRVMVAVAEANGTASEEWIAWARAKADWYDPTVAAIDEFLGKRKHEADAEDKALREKRVYSFYW